MQILGLYPPPPTCYIGNSGGGVQTVQVMLMLQCENTVLRAWSSLKGISGDSNVLGIRITCPPPTSPHTGYKAPGQLITITALQLLLTSSHCSDVDPSPHMLCMPFLQRAGFHVGMQLLSPGFS